MPDPAVLHLFEGVGIELEYMIVDAVRLDVLPICDKVMTAESGAVTSEIEFPDISWNNELVLHVIEFKTTHPVASFDGVADRFNAHIAGARKLLEPLGGTLMPTSMHPWMDPLGETKLWPHELGDVYETFNSIFDCRGHGWSNLQSLHINLPFTGDEEFGRLHAAIRLLLPIMPALAASSPIVEGRATGVLDNRLVAYRGNCARIPCVTGQVIPEPVFTVGAYQEHVLEVIFEALRPHDAAGVLCEEWVNARGAIPRFGRGSIEIRVLDVQECPAADLAIAAAITAVLKLLVAETWSSLAGQQAWDVEPLAAILDRTIRDADRAVIGDRDYLRALGWTGAADCTAGQLWAHLIDAARKADPAWLAPHSAPLDVILRDGPLARRILIAAGPGGSPRRLRTVYAALRDQLAAGEMFQPDVVASVRADD